MGFGVVLKGLMIAAEVAGVPGVTKKDTVMKAIPIVLNGLGLQGGITSEKLADPKVLEAVSRLIDARKAVMNAEAQLKDLGIQV